MCKENLGTQLVAKAGLAKTRIKKKKIWGVFLCLIVFLEEIFFLLDLILRQKKTFFNNKILSQVNQLSNQEK